MMARGEYYVASTSSDGQVLLWNLTNRKPTEMAQIPEVVGSAAFNPVMPVFSFGNHFPWGSVVRSVNLTTGKVVNVVETKCPNFCNIHAIEYSPDGLLLALCSSEHSVKLFHTMNPKQSKAAVPADQSTTAVAFAHALEVPKGAARFARADHLLAYGCRSGLVATAAVTITAARSGPAVAVRATEVAFPRPGGEVTRVQFSPDNRLLGLSATDGFVLLADVKTGKEVARFAVGEGAVNCFCFDPAGEFLAVASANGEVGVWDIASETKRATLTRHAQGATWVDVSPDGVYVASGGRDFTVKVYRVRSTPRGG